jgi:beta-phosphoglucomutase-like phosphatase (HAD superfamily)
MDGLLVDSERLERRVWQAAAADHGVEMSDERFATFIGNPIDVCEQMLAGYYGAGFDVDAYRETCHRHMRVIVDAEGVPMRPGALEWMEFVIGLGIPLGLATSSGPVLVHERLGGQLHRFAAVVSAPMWRRRALTSISRWRRGCAIRPTVSRSKTHHRRARGHRGGDAGRPRHGDATAGSRARR